MPLKLFLHEYCTQISLLQFCICVIARIKFQGRDTPCAPSLYKKPCTCVNMHKYGTGQKLLTYSRAIGYRFSMMSRVMVPHDRKSLRTRY